MVCADLRNVSGGPWFESRYNQDFIFTIAPAYFQENTVIWSYLVVFRGVWLFLMIPNCASRNAVRFLIIRFFGSHGTEVNVIDL